MTAAVMASSRLVAVLMGQTCAGYGFEGIRRSHGAPHRLRQASRRDTFNATNSEEVVMDWDEPRHKSMTQVMLGDDLKRLSVAELEDRVAALKTEIGRVEAEIEAKRKQQSAQTRFSGDSNPDFGARFVGLRMF